MGNRLMNTIGWTVIIGILMAVVNYFAGVNHWVAQTVSWVLPAAVGYFFGYGQAQRDENW